MEFTPKTRMLTPFSLTHHEQIYNKYCSNGVCSHKGSNLDNYGNYDKIYEDCPINYSDKSEISYDSIENSENLEINERLMYNTIYSIEKPVLEEISSFPKGDVRHYGRKTAFYNKKGTAEEHYLENFKREKNVDLINTSSYGVDISFGKNGHIHLESEVNYEDIRNDKIESSDLEINIEIKLNEPESSDVNYQIVDKTPISFSDLDCYEEVKSENIVENSDATKKEKKHRKGKKDKTKRHKRSEKKEKKVASDVEIVEEVPESPTEIFDKSTLIDFNTPILDVVDETDEPTVEEVEQLQIEEIQVDSEVNENEETIEDSLCKFEIDFSKFVEMEKDSSGDENAKDVQPKVIMKEKEVFDNYEYDPLLKEMSETDGDMDDSAGVSNFSSIEMVTTTEKNDSASITYVSEDKMFIITGTLEGFIHIWSFLQPYQLNEEKGLINSDPQEKRRKMSVGGDWEDEEELIQDHQMVNNTPLRKLEVLGWSDITNKPDLSFKAHESSIISLHIIPKTFSKAKIDYILVTTSLDRKVKVWKISNLDKKQNKSELLINVSIYSKDEKRKNEGPRISLLAQLENLEDIFVNAVFIPNTNNKIIVTRHTGVLEKFKLDLNSSSKRTTENNLSSVLKVNTDQKFIVGSISTSCNYYAVGGIDGNVRVYDVETLNLLDSYDCRNAKGSNSEGREVSGIEWNKKDDFMLVTTLDSRIRLLSFSEDYSKNNAEKDGVDQIKNNLESGVGNGKKLRYVEKFKGHTNYTNYVKARFFGDSEQMVMCPSESGHIYVWKISSPSYNYKQVNGPKNDEENERLDRVNIEKVIKNNDCFGFKIEARNVLGRLDIYNVNEWEKLFQMILNSRRKGDDDKEVGGCLMCKKAPKNENPNPNNDLLMITSLNGSEIKYSVLDVRYFQN